VGVVEDYSQLRSCPRGSVSRVNGIREETDLAGARDRTNEAIYPASDTNEDNLQGDPG
jgi:hypothetical protein